TGSHAPVGIISGLEDVREIDTYAWGAATLAHMYRALGKASRARCKSFVGCQTLLQSWIYEYFPSLRCRASPLPRAESEPLAGRWDGGRIAPRRALEGQNRLEMFREQLDRLTHTHVEWLPYGVNPFRGDALWSLYHGCIHAFDYMEPHDPLRVLRQYGFRQTHMVARTAPLHTPPERRPEDPKSYSVTYPPCNYQHPGALVAVSFISSPSVPGAEDGNMDPRVMSWYLARTHPYILPASFEAAAAGTLLGPSSYIVVRRYFDVSAPLFEPRSEEEFGARLSDMYQIVQSMRGLYLEYTGAP
ncbi:Protein MAIN-LIKE 2, partial [Linum grandiflorum]